MILDIGPLRQKIKALRPRGLLDGEKKEEFTRGEVMVVGDPPSHIRAQHEPIGIGSELSRGQVQCLQNIVDKGVKRKPNPESEESRIKSYPSRLRTAGPTIMMRHPHNN